MKQTSQSYKKSSFGPAFLFLSSRQRTALADYYEFCRRMDDIVDEPQAGNPAEELAFWRDEIQRVYNGQAQTDLGKKLTRHIKDFSIPEDRFLLLIEGMEGDLQSKNYNTLAELEWYLYRVAVVVGLATLDILDVKGPQAENLAKNLGGAVQITNIIRDVPADAELGRVYIPADILDKVGLSRGDILAGRQPDLIPQALKALDRVAQRLYVRAFKQMKQLPRLKMLPCRLMGCVYGSNLAKIRKMGFRFSQPVKLTKREKLKGVFHALFQTVFS